MMRIALAGLVTLFLLGACSSTSASRYSVTPQVQVTVKGAKKKTTGENYRVSPQDSKLTGSAGSAK